MASFNGETGAKEVVSALAKNVAGKTFLITGASKGSLGAEVATSLAAAGPKQFILVGRNEKNLGPVIEEIKSIDPKIKVTFVSGDMCDNDSLRKAGTEINALDVTIDSIICSAGIMAVREFTTSKDGIESQFAANHVGHFLLTNLIIGKLAKESSFVTVTSTGYEAAEVNFDDYNFQQGKTYNPWYAYGQATTAKILLAYAMGRKPGIAAFSVHPGYVPDTALQSNNAVDMDLLIEGFKIGVERNGGKPLDPTPSRTVQQGAATIVLAAVDSAIRSKSPAYLTECNVKVAKEYATSAENVQKLWKLSEKLVGQEFSL
ncbi:MAG: hypothetical protein M1818_005162 [Claussenomyces sp. TS43310]|nr:MAG: hypothetical protein M1818_005162 [Claussenomyces sp. TS43310]